VGRRKLRTEEELKEFLKRTKSKGRCVKYHVFNALQRNGPLTADGIIREIGEQAPGVASQLVANRLAQSLRYVKWVRGDYSTQNETHKRQITWHLNLSEGFYDEVNTGEEA